MDLDRFIAFYKGKIDNFTNINNRLGCKVWGGAVSGRRGVCYGVMRVRFPGSVRSRVEYVHRLAYMLENRNFNLDRAWHISHICHNRLCCNIDHLSYEPHFINNNRQACRMTIPKRCLGHQQYRNCLF